MSKVACSLERGVWSQQKAGPWAIELLTLPGFTAGTARVEERPEMLGLALPVTGEQEAAGSLWVGWGRGGVTGHGPLQGKGLLPERQA